MRKQKKDYDEGKITIDQLFDAFDKHDDLNKDKYIKAWNSKEYKENEKLIAKLEDQLAGVVLRDIGYEDNKRARDLISHIVFDR